NPGSLLGDAAAQGRRTHSSHGMDPSCDGSFAVDCRVRRGIDRARGVVSGDDAYCFRHFQYSRFLPRCCSNPQRRTRLSHLSRRDPSSGSEHFHRLIYGTWCVFSNALGRIICRSEVRTRLVRQLGAGGELVSLIGPSGCGKSTLLRLIAGLESSDSGELLIGSEKITQPGAERGPVFQDPNLFPWLTVRRNIQAGLVARGVLREKRHEVDDFMRLVGLETFADAYPHHLSGGMAQRVALARALINHPKVLLLDEPLGALDAFTRMRMQDEVLRLWQNRRTTMLLVTHDIDEAIYMSDRIIILTQRPGTI